MSQIVAFSGGKDPTAMALRLHELGESFELLFTPTGDELPELDAHLALVLRLVGKKRMILPPNKSLEWWINEYEALPNWRQRWCTRAIKIVPCIEYLKLNPGSSLLVGLRADEEEREGLYGDYAHYRYPLREWGWGVRQVVDYCRSKGVKIPERTDCAVCFYQRLGEWYRLWKNHPDRFERGVQWEKKTGHTFRSPSRDTWPASLEALRREFEKGRVPRGGEADEDGLTKCRVCAG